MDSRYLLQECVWKSDCGLAGAGERGGGWFITGNYVLTLTTLKSSVVSPGFILKLVHFSFPLEQARPLPKKKTYLGDENAKSLSLCSSKRFSMLKVNLSQGHFVFGSPKVAKHRFFFNAFLSFTKKE